MVPTYQRNLLHCFSIIVDISRFIKCSRTCRKKEIHLAFQLLIATYQLQPYNEMSMFAYSRITTSFYTTHDNHLDVSYLSFFVERSIVLVVLDLVNHGYRQHNCFVCHSLFGYLREFILPIIDDCPIIC